jgi:TolB protein
MNFVRVTRGSAIFFAVFFATLPPASHAADGASQRLVVEGAQRLVPLSLAGFPAEMTAVLKFDLELAGFKVVNGDGGLYTLSGAYRDGRLEGRLLNRSGTQVLGKAYEGPNWRSKTHALSDDVVLSLTGQKGIAQTQIAYKAEYGGVSEIFVADYDGHNAMQVTQDNATVAAPTWAPGRRLLLYTSYKLDNPDIFYHDLGTGKRAVIASYTGLNTSPAVSAQGKVAMILSKDGSPDIYTCDLNGANLKQLTFTREDESSPCWSPDGEWICYAAKVDERRSLFKIPAGGGTARRIAIDGAINPTEPDWSPDGKWIAFTCQRREFELCIVPSEGGVATTLVDGEDPSWAPNSRNIIFTRRKNGRRYLCVLDVFTKHVKDVAQLSGNCSQPSWAK